MTDAAGNQAPSASAAPANNLPPANNTGPAVEVDETVVDRNDVCIPRAA